MINSSVTALKRWCRAETESATMKSIAQTMQTSLRVCLFLLVMALPVVAVGSTAANEGMGAAKSGRVGFVLLVSLQRGQ